MPENQNIPSFHQPPSENKTLGRKKHIISALILAAIFITAYFLVSRSGVFSLMERLSSPKAGYALIFFIGFLSGFYCIGRCGGLVAAYSAKILEEKNTVSLKYHWQYNLGRLISYSAVGLLLGAFGEVFFPNETISGILLVLVSLFVLTVGFKLLTGVRLFGFIRIGIPFLNKAAGHIKNNIGKLPLGIGLISAFIPCGPLSAMYFYSLSTGSAVRGFFSMAFYALGTMPAIFSFGWAITFLTKDRFKSLLKIFGAIVIILSLIMLSRGVGSFYFVRQAERKAESKSSGQREISAEQYYANSQPTDKYQTIEMEITPYGFKPNVINIKGNLPIRWIIKNGGVTACTDEVILYMDGKKLNYKIASPQSIIKFMPIGSEIKFSSASKIAWGKFSIQ